LFRSPTPHPLTTFTRHAQEEKKLRKKLNPQISATYPLRMIPKGEDAAAAAAAPAPPAGGAGAPPATA